ncbi:hypothetical protein ACIQHY_31875 [Streptomyces sp. NPDC092359]|uniref:hypothetical protein n=1 Tax=Streptomyces sp. NPDC092359 TaxID=3366014 RepID=UPI0037F28DEE
MCVETRGQRCRYAGPAELKKLVRARGEGRSIRSSADFGEWVSALTPDELAEALGGIGIHRPSGFTNAVVFRRCHSCRELNIVREKDFVCVFCGEDLPQERNVGEPG